MSGGRNSDAGDRRGRAVRGWALALAWALLLVLPILIVLRDRSITRRVEDLEARAGALEAFARRQRAQISELQAGGAKPVNLTRPDTVALVIELAGDDFPQVIVRAGLDAEHEQRIVVLLPGRDRQRLDEMRKEWPTLAVEDKQRFVSVLTADIEEGIRREAPALFVARPDIEQAVHTALDSAAGALDSARPDAGSAADSPGGQ